jgi:hypothetical protein
MRSLPNIAKSDLAEPSQCKKRKLKKTNAKKTNVDFDGWAALEWTCVDSPTSTVDE